MAKNQITGGQSKDNTSKSRLSSCKNWFSTLRWVPTSEKELELSEQKILSHIEGKHKLYYVDIGEESIASSKREENLRDEKTKDEKAKLDSTSEVKDNERKIWTLEMEPKELTNKSPILLLHGFNLALAIWVLNLDEISEVRKIWAIDMLGFGRSSRPKFKPRENAELELVEAVESWRKKVGIEKFTLLGHSFGGYIAASYALKYGKNLDRLILVDVWGFSADEDIITKVPFWLKGILKIIFLTNSNPMTHLRVSGPIGKHLVCVRDDIKRKFEEKLKDESDEILKYLYHCNVSKPSGELIFKQISTEKLTARRPIIFRAKEISPNIKLTFMYGAESWLRKEKEETVQKLFPNNELDYKVFKNSGHHIYSDEPKEFNSFVNSLD